MKHLYIVRSADFGKIFCNFCNNPIFFCLFLFDTFFKCLSNVNLLSKVNPKCFRDDAWEANLIQYKPFVFHLSKNFLKLLISYLIYYILVILI